MLIDTHAHLGSCRVFGAHQSVDDLLSAMDSAEVDAAVVQPFPGSDDATADHDLIAEAAQRYPGRIYGVASLNPHGDPVTYWREITRCVRDLGFVGVKLHPIGHAVRPGSDDGRRVAETAAELGVPVMIHTGAGLPFADPAAWLPLARDLPELTVVLGHAGAGLSTGSAITVASVCQNVVLETSWCNPQDIRAAVETLGPGKVMFGSDMRFNIEVEQAKYRAITLDADTSGQVLAGTASRVFGLGRA